MELKSISKIAMEESLCCGADVLVEVVFKEWSPQGYCQ